MTLPSRHRLFGRGLVFVLAMLVPELGQVADECPGGASQTIGPDFPFFVAPAKAGVQSLPLA